MWERTGAQPAAVIQTCVDLSGGLGGQTGGSDGSTPKGSLAGRSVVGRPMGRIRAGEQWFLQNPFQGAGAERRRLAKKQNCINGGSNTKHPKPMAPRGTLVTLTLIRYTAHLWSCCGSTCDVPSDASQIVGALLLHPEPGQSLRTCPGRWCSKGHRGQRALEAESVPLRKVHSLQGPLVGPIVSQPHLGRAFLSLATVPAPGWGALGLFYTLEFRQRLHLQSVRGVNFALRTWLAGHTLSLQGREIG